MPTTANITNTAAIAFTVPASAWGFVISNPTTVTVLYRIGGTVSTSGDTLGIPLYPGETRYFGYANQLFNPVQVQMIRSTGSDAINLTYDILERPYEIARNGDQANFATLGGSPSDNAALNAALDAKLDNVNGIYIARIVGVPVLTTGAPADVATLVLPSWLTRYSIQSFASFSTNAGSNRIIATSAAGTLAAAQFALRDAASGGGNALVAYAGPASTSAGVAGTMTLAASLEIRTANTLFLNQSANSANAGVVNVYFAIQPLLN